MVWQESDAAEKFEEFLDAAGKEGPQVVARCGVEVAVLVSAKEWKDLNAKSQKSTLASSSQEKH
jgi:prevent-host-death family protein